MAQQRPLLPWALLLGTIFFLSSQVCAAGAVLGVDLGTEYIKAALVKPGMPLDIVLTKDSRRKETSAVAFKPIPSGPKAGSFPERFYGADAVALAPRFPGEVFPNLKVLLGLPVDDAVVREYAARHPALQLEAHKSRGTPAFKSNTFPAGEDAWLVEELLAMELQSIQKNAEAAAGGSSSVSIRSVVLTVPPFYTAEEKRAVEAAADMAGLKVLALVSDGLAVGLNYATSRQFPNINEGAKPEYHLVFDMGAGSTSATLMRFQARTVKDVGKYNKTFQEVQVMGTGWDRSLGGDALNYLIMDDMVSQFVASPKAASISVTTEAVQSHGRAMAKLIKEAERVRHVLSANQNTHASFEGLYGDVDFKYKLTRADFEAMAAAYTERVGKVIKGAIDASAIDLNDLTSVILHGGATRTPMVQKAIEKAVGSSDKMRSNVNADEAAVFGAGFRAAELSPSFRVKEIRISEGPMYEAGLKWTSSNGKQRRQRLWKTTSPMGGPAKEMTFSERNDFTITFYQQVEADDREMMKVTTQNLTATIAAMKDQHPTCEEADLVFKAAFQLSSGNGEIQVARAIVECKAEMPEKGFVDGVKNLFGFGKKDQQPLKDEDKDKEDKTPEGSEETFKDDAEISASSLASASSSSASSSSSSTSSSSATQSSTEAQSSETSEPNKKASEADTEAKAEVKKKEAVSIPVKVTLEKAGRAEMSKTELTAVKNRLKSFAASDKARVQREEAVNQLEAFAYKVRDLVEGENFISRSTEKERSVLSDKASEINDWLYGDGAEATKEELKAKLKSLEELVKPVQTRIDEAKKRPELVSSLKRLLNETSIFITTLREQFSEYENWQASSSASSSGKSSTTPSVPSESPTGHSEKPEGKNDGADTKETADKTDKEDKEDKEDKAKDTSGPPPPLYKKEDVDGIEALYTSTLKWLSEVEAKQDGLALTSEPVLLAKDLLEKKQKLDKAGMELAVKGMKNFEYHGKKAGKDKSKAKSGGGSGSGSDTKGPGGAKVDEAELNRILEELRKVQADKDKADADKNRHDEL